MPSDTTTASANQQHTLAQSATLAGTSLHTGEEVTLTVRPAPADHGIKFKRVDLPDEPTISALIANVRHTERATTLGEGNIKVVTVEHVISALVGLGVDNALVEMNANEPPIVDGSALPFVELIKKAGIAPQNAPRHYFEVREPIHVETASGGIITIVPDAKFRVTCTQAGPGGRFTQLHSTEITPAIYEKEIAPARTFVYYEDVKPLMDKGLIKGGSLENAVVIRGDSVMSKEALRFPDEFVRHKILDIIGDLALLGRPIKGHIIAIRPGHGANAELTKKLAKALDAMLQMVPAHLPGNAPVLDIKEIMRILPHRYPFLLVDRIIGFDGDNKCTGIKNVTMNEPFFQGHFPAHPIMPGVLQVEAMAQVSSILLTRQTGQAGKIGYFMSADNVKFRKPVLPGDTLYITAELTKSRRNIGKATCQCQVNGVVVSEGDLMFTLVDA